METKNIKSVTLDLTNTFNQNKNHKTRLSLSDIDEQAQMAFNDNELGVFSDMLQACTAKKVTFTVLNSWIAFLDNLKKDKKEDGMACTVIAFYRSKLHSKRYLMKLNRPTRPMVQLDLKRPSKAVDYNLARAELASIAKEFAELRGKKFILHTEEERMQWQLILRWFIFDEDSVWDVEKSAYIYGLTGRGKTFAFNCLQELGKRIIKSGLVPEVDFHFYEWDFVDLRTLHKKCSGLEKEGDKPSFSPAKKLKYKNWCIDELCNESLILKVYAQEYRFFEQILTDREFCKTSAKRALFIGNNNVPDMHKYYANDVNYDYNTEESRFSSRWKGMVGYNNMVWSGLKDMRS